MSWEKPEDIYKIVELVIKIAFENPKLLRYRKYYPAKTEDN
jgi:hypothetical protein